jgi:hypothetical protein
MTIYRLSLSEKIGGEHRGYQYFTAHEAMEKCKAEANSAKSSATRRFQPRKKFHGEGSDSLWERALMVRFR